MSTSVHHSSREASSSAHRASSSPTRPGRPSDDRGGVVPLLPTGDGVLLEDAHPLKRVGLLLVIHEGPQYRGWVRAVGPEVTDLAVGDLVAYRPFVGARIEVDGISWMLVREAECVCKLG